MSFKASTSCYREIFNECFNLGFCRLYHDQCWTCLAYTNAIPEEQNKQILNMVDTYPIKTSHKTWRQWYTKTKISKNKICKDNTL